MNKRIPTSEKKLESIEELTQQYNKLNDAKVRAETNLENASAELKRLQQEAVEQFGTSDIAELQKQLDEAEALDRRQREEYRQHLRQIEDQLNQVEKQTGENPGSN